jgi:tetratricopeptide (TPR) repeat protein
MVKKTDFDIQVVHGYFSKECFNRAWDYIDKPVRTKSEEDAMLHLSLTSLWHWAEREDCTPTNLSIGYWQVSRVFALLGQTDNARHYGELCLEASQKDDVLPFYLGYAYEALARAALVAGNLDEMEEFLNKAKQVAAKLPDPQAKQQLLSDLATIH